MKKYVFLFVLFATPALAQQPQSIKLDITVAEAQKVLNALAEGPWKDVNPLMQKLIAQVNPQLAPPKPPAPPSNPEPEIKGEGNSPEK
jgi:hypothetical protein